MTTGLDSRPPATGNPGRQPAGTRIPAGPVAIPPGQLVRFRYRYLPTPETRTTATTQAAALINLPAHSQTDTGKARKTIPEMCALVRAGLRAVLLIRVPDWVIPLPADARTLARTCAPCPPEAARRGRYGRGPAHAGMRRARRGRGECAGSGPGSAAGRGPGRAWPRTPDRNRATANCAFGMRGRGALSATVSGARPGNAFYSRCKWPGILLVPEAENG
jgi:hypothetical protein